MIKINKFLDGKSYCIAPHNDIAEQLNSYVGCRIPSAYFNGYIDKKKGGINLLQIKTDYILIISPNYYNEISKYLREKQVNRSKIIYVYKGHYYVFSNFQFIYAALETYSQLNYLIKNPFYLRNKIKLLIAYLFHIKLSKNEKKLASLKNKHEGDRVFVIGNGPSLEVNDLDKLQKEFTFGANKIYLAFNETNWRPTYYTVEDNLVLIQNYEQIKMIQDSIKIFPNNLLKLKAPIEDSIYFDFIHKGYYPDLPSVSQDPFKGLFWGATVIFTMIQLAIYMGFKEIYLIGIDFNFIIPTGPEQTPNELIYQGEKNHFHKDYRKKNEKWNIPNLKMQEKSFLAIKNYCILHNITLKNISRKSCLEIIEKGDFEDIIGKI